MTRPLLITYSMLVLAFIGLALAYPIQVGIMARAFCFFLIQLLAIALFRG